MGGPPTRIGMVAGTRGLMEPKFLICESELSFELLKSAVATNWPDKYDIFKAAQFEEGNIVIRLTPLDPEAVKLIPILLSAVGGIAWLPPESGTALKSEELAVLPESAKRQLPNDATGKMLYDLVRKQSPHEKSFEQE